MFCDRCGTPNRSLARFCRTCGEGLTSIRDPTGTGTDDDSTLEVAPSPGAPVRLGERYAVLGEIGRGGMGVVYAVHDPVLERDVAVKLIRRDYSDDSAIVTRFLREARIAARLRHPNIVSIHDVGRDERGHFYVMDYIDGRNLAEVVDERGSLPLGDAKRVILDVAKAVAHAHGSGVLHRDLKPENVMLDQDGHVVVLDFGLARAVDEPRTTRVGVAIGSPRYMSPEQIEGRDADERSDVFSVGLLFYFLLAGSPMFGESTFEEIKAAHAKREIDRNVAALELPSSVSDILMSLLARDPGDRCPDLLLAARFEEFRLP